MAHSFKKISYKYTKCLKLDHYTDINFHWSRFRDILSIFLNITILTSSFHFSYSNECSNKVFFIYSQLPFFVPFIFLEWRNYKEVKLEVNEGKMRLVRQCVDTYLVTRPTLISILNGFCKNKRYIRFWQKSKRKKKQLNSIAKVKHSVHSHSRCTLSLWYHAKVPYPFNKNY